VDWEDKLGKLCDEMRTDIPGFEIRYKTDSKLQKFIGWVLKPFNKRYMSHFTTTLYPYVYFPDREFVSSSPRRTFEILSHEWVHLYDRKKDWKFSPLYLFPQILSLFSVFAIGAIWNLWFLLFLSFLLCLVPFPAPYRTKYEFRGYAMNMMFRVFRFGKVSGKYKEWLRGTFTGWSYYKMNPFTKDVNRKIDALENKLKEGTIQKLHPYNRVIKIYKEE